MPVRPTRQNNRKRNETASLVSLARISAAKSSATRVSSLLSPCWRSPNTNGSSAMRKRAARGRHDVEQDLEALRGELRRQLLEAVAPHHEEAAHRIAQASRRAGGARARSTARLACSRRALDEPGRRAAVDIAARDREIGLAAQLRQHRGEQRLVVLQVGVHHGDVARLARQHALDAGAGEAAPADAADAAHARCRSRRSRARPRRCRRANCRRRTRLPSRRPASVRASFSTSSGTLSRSLKVGTTTLSSGAGPRRRWRARRKCVGKRAFIAARDRRRGVAFQCGWTLRRPMP